MWCNNCTCCYDKTQFRVNTSQVKTESAGIIFSCQYVASQCVADNCSTKYWQVSNMKRWIKLLVIRARITRPRQPSEISSCHVYTWKPLDLCVEQHTQRLVLWVISSYQPRVNATARVTTVTAARDKLIDMASLVSAAMQASLSRDICDCNQPSNINVLNM